MKLNNKGFAITGILYTVFVLFLMILLSVISGLNIKRQLLEKNMENMKESLEETCTSLEEEIDSDGFFAKYQGKYVIQINGNNEENYETYLSVGQTLFITDNIIKTSEGNTVNFIKENPQNVTSAKITEICTTDTVI